MANASSELAPLIAVIGCDGSGKSTVSEQVLEWVRGYGPAAAAHLGKQAGNIGRWLSELPLIGKWFERLINRKVVSVNNSHAKNKTPGFFPSLVMYAFTLRRMRRFRRMLALRQQGLIIITDRFPQLEFPRAYDGPALSVSAEGNFFIRWLAKREQAAFEWMTSFKPDLVLRLNVDLDTACARKPDHRREALRKKVEITPQLTFNGAPIAEIDTNQPLPEVVAAAKEAVTRTLTERGYKRSEV
ncbi:MAG TPA: thymidylate kinase [Gammaproteobacteria bacterium]|nr:thymidylate kinase [Gammaproteobacteria bacterium]